MESNLDVETVTYKLYGSGNVFETFLIGRRTGSGSSSWRRSGERRRSWSGSPSPRSSPSPARRSGRRSGTASYSSSWTPSTTTTSWRTTWPSACRRWWTSPDQTSCKSWSVLWNRNYLLRSRFRLWKIFGSAVPDPCPDIDQILAQFFKWKMLHKVLMFFNVRSTALLPWNLLYNFVIFWLMSF